MLHFPVPSIKSEIVHTWNETAEYTLLIGNPNPKYIVPEVYNPATKIVTLISLNLGITARFSREQTIKEP